MIGLSVLAPGLARAVARSESEPLLALRKLAGRGQWIRHSDTCFERGAFAAFGWQPRDAGRLPVAALDYYGATGRFPGGHCLRIDPVHLEPRRAQLYLLAGPLLGVQRDEADALTDRINHLYAEEGWRLEPLTPDRWYLVLDHDPGLQATALSVAAGRDVDRLLPRGARGAWWHARMNEIQMLLHGAPVNVRREQEDRYTLNSVWPWGYGPMPQLPAAPWGCVWADEPLTRGLALYTGCRIQSVPRELTAILSQPPVTKGLVVLGDSWSLLHGCGTQATRIQLQHMERRWWLPVLEALERRDLGALTLIDPGAGTLTVTCKDVRRWWRRIPPLRETWGQPPSSDA